MSEVKGKGTAEAPWELKTPPGTSDYLAYRDKESVALRLVRLEGRLACAAYVAGAAVPAYFILLDFEDGRVSSIRDFRYVPYIAAEADFELIDG